MPGLVGSSGSRPTLRISAAFLMDTSVIASPYSSGKKARFPAYPDECH
jgi:hypothetical protein